MRVGIVYDIFSDYVWRSDDPPDADAEYEPVETILVIEEALRWLKHTPVRMGSPFNLLNTVEKIDVDAVINISEGIDGRNREAYAPILLEMRGIPYLGSDALPLSVSLDKAWTKDILLAAGYKTPSYRIYHAAEAVTRASLPADFPLFIKPRYEGSSKSITRHSKVEDIDALREQVHRICTIYKQDALVESFVEGGGEFTVAVIGHNPPEAMPVLQRAVEKETRIGLHALDRRGLETPGLAYEIEGDLTNELEDQLKEESLGIYNKLECNDFARIDFRVDGDGVPWFLEINPLPTFAPDGTFAILAELMGIPYVEFLADTMRKGFERIGVATT
ncbi:MAG: D-alanine--D-alanine ligase [Rhodothermaceae bacterium]|nr:D-alanine--D-alanine ligase [Rhodothermaceae bacterium]